MAVKKEVLIVNEADRIAHMREKENEKRGREAYRLAKRKEADDRQRSLEQIPLLVEKVLSALKERGYPGSELIGGHAAWSLTSTESPGYKGWDTPVTTTYYLLSTGKFAAAGNVNRSYGRAGKLPVEPQTVEACLRQLLQRYG